MHWRRADLVYQTERDERIPSYCRAARSTGKIRRNHHRPPFSLDPIPRQRRKGIRFDLSDHARALESLTGGLPLDEQTVGLSADDGRLRRVLRVPDASIHAHPFDFSGGAYDLRPHSDLPYLAGISAEEARARSGHQNGQESAKAAGVKRVTVFRFFNFPKRLTAHPAAPSPRVAAWLAPKLLPRCGRCFQIQRAARTPPASLAAPVVRGRHIGRAPCRSCGPRPQVFPGPAGRWHQLRSCYAGAESRSAAIPRSARRFLQSCRSRRKETVRECGISSRKLEFPCAAACARNLREHIPPSPERRSLSR